MTIPNRRLGSTGVDVAIMGLGGEGVLRTFGHDMVIMRKVSFGTRSDSGLKTHSIIPTLVQTARRQGVHPREFLQTLHTADTKAAQAALYNNSS